MSPRLPDSVDPWRIADSGKRFAGSIPLDQLKRLCEALTRREGEAEFELAFHRDQQRRVLIDGRVKALLSLECQRCLGPMEHRVDSTFHLAVIEVADEVERIPEHCEPVQAEDGEISPLALIEDELLLSIPQVPMHDRAECPADPGFFRRESVGSDEVDEEAPPNPFAVLAALKSDEKN